MKRIGLVVAMPEETEHILKRLGEETSNRIISSYQVTTFNINDREIYLVNSGVGEINSAAATMLLIDRFSVEVIINFGIAGALKPHLRVGDLLIAKDIIHTDFDVSAFLELKRGQYIDSDSRELVISDNLLTLADKANGAPLIRVRIASADKFIASKIIRQELIDVFDADICEMESAGIVRIANRCKVPSLFIKTISDSADEEATTTINETVSKGITSYANLIENLLNII